MAALNPSSYASTFSKELNSKVLSEESLVIEIGSSCSKFGFTGESYPRHILPSRFILFSGKELCLNSALGKGLHSRTEWEEALELFLHSAFFRYLHTNPKDRKIVISENIASPSLMKLALLNVLFHKFKVNSVFFAPTQFLCMLPLSISPGSFSYPSVVTMPTSNTGSKSGNKDSPTTMKLYESNPSSIAMIIDCGFMETRILPVYCGSPLVKGIVVAPPGSSSILASLSSMLMERATVRYRVKDSESTTVIKPLFSELCREKLEDIVTRLLFIYTKRTVTDVFSNVSTAMPWPKHSHRIQGGSFSSSSEEIHLPPNDSLSDISSTSSKRSATAIPSSSSSSSSSSSMTEKPSFVEKSDVQRKQIDIPSKKMTEYPLDANTTLLIDDYVRSLAATNALFGGSGLLETSVATLVLDALRKCPPDTRIEFAQRLVLAGGICQMSGFRSRLLSELDTLCQSDSSYECLRGLEFHLLDSLFPSNTLSWTGASIIGTLESVAKYTITKEKFQTHTLPISTDII